MYNPHERPDLAEEADLMSRGRLVKARLPEQAPPNVSWFWVQTGNCLSCRYFATDKCLNPKIPDADFLNLYLYVNTCPEFEAGVSDEMVAAHPGRTDFLDVMRAAGIVVGKPGQKVDIILDRPWSVDLAVRAHKEQSVFMDMARGADHPSRGDYTDLTDDLERADAVAAPTGGAGAVRIDDVSADPYEE
jgi:hypothetical protein